MENGIEISMEVAEEYLEQYDKHANNNVRNSLTGVFTNIKKNKLSVDEFDWDPIIFDEVLHGNERVRAAIGNTELLKVIELAMKFQIAELLELKMFHERFLQENGLTSSFHIV